jgi:hypothetical protein
METYPDLELLPEPLKESLDSTDSDKQLLAALQRGKFEAFSKFLNQTNANLWYDEPYHSSLLEIACQMKQGKSLIKLLLDSGADPNIKNRVTGMPLLHATARSKNFEVLQVLLEKKGIDTSLKDEEKGTILHWLAGVSEGKSGDKEKIECCLQRLLESNYFQRKHIDDRDISGNTAIYTTMELGFRDRAKLLLSKGADVRVFERGSKIFLSDSISIVNEILDDCLRINDKPPTSKDLKLTFNWKPVIEIVPHIAESKYHRDLLTHPVMKIFLSLNWKLILIYFSIDTIMYLIILLVFTSTIIRLSNCNTINDGGADNNTIGSFSFNNTNITSGMNNCNITTQKYSVIIPLTFLYTRAFGNLCVLGWYYVRLPEKWLDILLMIALFLYDSPSVESAELKRHSSAVALFLGWSELLLMSGRLPQLSVQLEMLRTVTLTFLRYMMGYVTLLIAFALSFYILFRGSSEQNGAEMFTNPFASLLQTVVMFTGEFEVSSLSFETLPYTSHVIFLLFVFLVAIVLLNLLNGLAVGDTEKIRREAKTLSLAARAKLVCRFIRIEFFTDVNVIYPNQRNSIGSVSLRSILDLISKKRQLNGKNKSTGTEEEWSLFKEKLSVLQFRQDELEKKLDSKFDETFRILRQILTDRHEV